MPLSVILSAGTHFDVHGDPGRALSYGTYAAGGSLIAGTITKYVVGTAYLAPKIAAGTTVVLTKVGAGAVAVTVGVAAAPVVIVVAVGTAAYFGLRALYNNNEWVRTQVDAAGNAINAFAAASTPAQGGVLESEFWTPEALSHQNGIVGQAISSSDWIAGSVEKQRGD